MNSNTNAALALVASGFTATGLADALARVTSATDSPEAVSRLQAIVGGLTVIPLKDARQLLTEAVKVNAAIKTRASEGRTIVAAHKLVAGFSAEGMGWHRCYNAAKKALTDAKLTNSGGKLLDKAEKAEAKAARDVGAEAERLAKEPGAGELTLAQIAERAKASVLENDSKAHGERIFKAKGAAYALALADVLIGLADGSTVEAAEETPAEQ